MAVYDFQCESCGKLFDYKMSMADFDKGIRPECPDCGNSTPARSFKSSINVLTSHAGPKVTYESQGGCGSGSGGCGCGKGSCGCG